MLTVIPAEQARQMIEDAGGTAAFARLLGLDREDGYLARVGNWKERGIPLKVIIAHYPTISNLHALLKTKQGANRKRKPQ